MEYNNMTSKARRKKAYVGLLGTTQIHLRSPLIIAWWSAAFPGFGHLLLSKYLRGFALFILEIIININANINLAIMYSLGGQFNLAKEVLDPRWMLLYFPLFSYAIWDSYRATIDLNKVALLADRENAPFVNFQITAMEINFLDKKTPRVAVIWSIFMPGAGQLYLHRLITAFFILILIIIIIYMSHVLEGIHFIILGNLDSAKSILNGEWLLFIPSVYMFAIYDAYVNTVENNKLFCSEQKSFLRGRYQQPTFKLPINFAKRDE